MKYHFTINYRTFDWVNNCYSLPKVLHVDTDDRQYAIKWMQVDSDNKELMNWNRKVNDE